MLDRFRPVAAFEAVANALAVNFTNQSPESCRAVWDFGDGQTSNEIQPTHVYSAPGEYNVRLATYNRNLACDTNSITVVVGGSVFSGEILEGNINVYPNPVKNRINITGVAIPYEVSVFDISGRQRMARLKTETRSVDVSFLENGFYILEIKTGNS